MMLTSAESQRTDGAQADDRHRIDALSRLRRWWRGTNEVAAFFRAGVVALAAFLADES